MKSPLRSRTQVPHGSASTGLDAEAAELSLVFASPSVCSVSPSGFAKLAYTVQADTDTGLLRFDRDKRQVWGQWARAGHCEAGRGWGRVARGARGTGHHWVG